MTTQQELVAEPVRLQANGCGHLGSPFYEFLLTKVAEDVERSGPAWGVLRETLNDPPDSAPALRLMGTVHRLVLQGELPKLARFYPSAGGRVDAEQAWPAFRTALAERADDIRSLLPRTVQTNEVGRAASIVGGFLTVARETGLSLRTLEVGASAGFLSRWDHYQYEAHGLRWGDPGSPVNLCSFNSDIPLPFEVSARVEQRLACDRNPVDVTTEEGRLTLTSYIWADQVHRVRLMKQACEVARRVPVTIDRRGAVDWVSDKLRDPVSGAATVLFHSIVMQYLSDADRSRFESTIRTAGAGATKDAPLAWLRMEPADEEAHVHLTLWPEGKEKLVATTGYHGHDVRWLGW